MTAPENPDAAAQRQPRRQPTRGARRRGAVPRGRARRPARDRGRPGHPVPPHPGRVVGGYLGVDMFFVDQRLPDHRAAAARARRRPAASRCGAFWRRRARRLLPALGVLRAGLLHRGLRRSAATCSSASAGRCSARRPSAATGCSLAGGSSYFDDDHARAVPQPVVARRRGAVLPASGRSLLAARADPQRRAAARASSVGLLAVASAVAMALLYTPGGDATRVYYGTDTHSFGLALGAVLALLADRVADGARSRGRGGARRVLRARRTGRAGRPPRASRVHARGCRRHLPGRPRWSSPC